MSAENELQWVLRRQYGTEGPSNAQQALLLYPRQGIVLRATVHMRWRTWDKLKKRGLVEGTTERSSLTTLGRSVRDLLLERLTPLERAKANHRPLQSVDELCGFERTGA